MSVAPVSVLLVGSQLRESVYVEEQLRRWNCDCHLASSIQQATRLLGWQGFQLVLSKIRLIDGSVYALIPHLLGRSTTLFVSFAIDGGCLWLPVLENGRDCFKEALRPSGFFSFLESFLGPLPEASNPEVREGSPHAIMRIHEERFQRSHGKGTL